MNTVYVCSMILANYNKIQRVRSTATILLCELNHTFYLNSVLYAFEMTKIQQIVSN